MALRDIIGHKKQINILLGTIKRDRISSAYLFAGESGIGKKTAAINFAKVLNCKNPKEDDSCDECASCRKIDAGTHPDFLIISPEKGEICVEEVRNIEETLSFAPYEGKRRIVIVDDSETMNSFAANAFLKTLEEPPHRSTIILITSSPDRLPETIRSRCSRINFSSLSPEMCRAVIIRAEGKNLKAEKQVLTLARLSMGRPGLTVSDDLIEERNSCIKVIKAMLDWEDKGVWADKEEMEKWFDSVSILIRDMAIQKIMNKDDMLVNADIGNAVKGMSGSMSIDAMLELYSRVALLKTYLKFNLNKAVTWNYLCASFSKNMQGKSSLDNKRSA
ncbi:MAG: DNA polymerase III subunit delta' [Nitrospiraceae bacterium]|nr:DNA polymerase III subunit delta' [Nitrospiraceae bacterium]